MEDFFKQFRENLENRPEPEFEERDWKDMRARLERQGNNRPAIFAWWWLAVPIMLLLTGSNAFFFWQWEKTAQRLYSLETKRDTVFHTQVVFTTDTIYRTRVVREKVIEYKTLHGQKGAEVFSNMGNLSLSGYGGLVPKNGSQQKTELLSHQIGQAKSELPGRLDAEKIVPAGEDTRQSGGDGLMGSLPANKKIEAKDQIVQNTTPLQISKIRPVQRQRPVLILTDCEVLVPAKRKRFTFSDHLYAARPKAFQLGLTSGLAYPFGSGVDFKSGYSISLRTAIEFSPKLRLWADAAYFKTLFLTDRMSNGIGVPPEDPPSDQYVFLQAEVPQPFFQYSAGMQYLFRSKHRLKPFVGLGLGAISLLPYDVIYEFENTTLGVEWNLDKTIHRQGLIGNFLVLPFGTEFGFSNHWNAQVQATYRYNWKTTGVQSPNMFGIQGGVNYRF